MLKAQIFISLMSRHGLTYRLHLILTIMNDLLAGGAVYDWLDGGR
jgi:hypothetical protein